MSLANLTRPGSNFKLAQVIQESIWLALCFSPLLLYSVCDSKGSPVSLECVPAPGDKTPYFMGR